MSDIYEEMKLFLQSKDVKFPNLSKFCDSKPQIIKAYIKHFDTQDEADKNLKNKMKLAQKEVKPNSKRGIGLSCNITSLYAEARAEESITGRGWQALEASVCSNTSTFIKNKSRHTEEANREDDNDAELSSNDETSEDDGPNDNDDIIFDGHNLSTGFREFKQQMQIKAKQVGFYLDANLQELLSLFDVLFLKAQEHEGSLNKFFGSRNLNDYQQLLVEKYMDTNTCMNPSIFSSLIVVLKDLHSVKTKRRDIKEKVNNIAKLCDDDDYQLIDIIINCINKLPDHERLHEDVGEAELICSFLDTVVSPLFHDIKEGKLFRWTNTMVDDTDTKRPDGHMSQLEERIIQFSTGFIEVKPAKSRTSSQKTHEDTLRLVNFCKDAMDKKKMKSIIAVQAVGYYVSFYLFTRESSELHVLCELLSVNVPKSISELPEFFTHFDELKQVMLCHRSHCCVMEEEIAHTSNSKKRSLQSYDLRNIVNIKKPRGVHASLSLK